ncbi:MAG: hypothetical protein QOI55_2085 [Actinomycetota bacterium]|nr:hypothetical protein [Actinomycetota bacterium]
MRKGTAHSKARRFAALVASSLIASFVMVVGTALPSSAATITSGGPLTSVTITPDLNCAVNHTGDASPEFFGTTACATFVAVGGTLFGPASVPAGGGANPHTAFTPVSQTAVSGTGTGANPFKIVTVVTAGTSGLRLTETDTYVTGEESYRTDVTIQNNGTSQANVLLYRAGDCYLQNSDQGFGKVDTATGAVSCVNAVFNSTTGVFTPGSRIEQWFPLSSGSHYYEDYYSSVWGRIGTQLQFADSCAQCANHVDNGAGLSWSVPIAAGGSATRSHLTTFSPLGFAPLSTTKTADAASASPGATDGYTITITNPNAQNVTLNSITDTLPTGFSYVAGSTTGATTANPSIVGQQLTWAGPITVAHNASRTLHFQVHVSSTAGDYFNNAGADAAGSYTVAPTGDTAKITVTGQTGDRTPPACALTSALAGPPKAIKVTVGDTGSGLATITVVTHNNATVTYPAFTSGTTSSVVVTGTKINQTLASQVALQVKDVAGNTTNCDPVLATLTGSHKTVSTGGLAAEEHFVRITNAKRGLRAVNVTVNGHRFSAPLAAGQSSLLDVASAIRPGNHNRITLVGIGSGAADVLVWDGSGS